MKPTLLTYSEGRSIELPARGALPRTVHVFDDESVLAVNAALAVRRPLLIRGEPGTGKSQLARAAAHALGRVYLPKVIDARTETVDLFYAFDAVARLAEAQLCGALGHADEAAHRSRLDEQNFLKPGPLWWAFDWASAEAQATRSKSWVPDTPAGFDPKSGAVVLLDEIDKADTSVPNGLLEALGNGEFTAQAFGRVAITGQPPLVIITTNEERVLPDAFLRRCLVLQLRLPETKEALVDWLMRRGQAHYPESSDELRQRAAELLWEDRTSLATRGLAPPGQAEYLDLLKAVTELAPSAGQQLALLERVAAYTLRKHPAETRE